MKKCMVCRICSWIVGLAVLDYAIVGFMGIELPSTTVFDVLYIVLGLIALGFLYYQIVPCPRCAAHQMSR